MSKITLSADAAAAIMTAQSKSELYGPDGVRLGVFIPPTLAAELEALLEERRRIFDEDAPSLATLQAADAAGGEYTMDDVLRLLGSENR
jgi:hypothetical protein